VGTYLSHQGDLNMGWMPRARFSAGSVTFLFFIASRPATYPGSYQSTRLHLAPSLMKHGSSAAPQCVLAARCLSAVNITFGLYNVLKILSRLHTSQPNRRIIVKHEMGRIWNEAVLSYFKVLLQHLSCGHEENKS
jgi:hypothetical protein